MILFLSALKIRNFKGVIERDLNFTEITNLHGANRSGKTTMVPDALNWLLTGKDAQDREKFDIKNTVLIELNRGEHSVEGDFTHNGYSLNLKRVFKELWITPKGSEFPELKGNTTNYFINGTPKQQGEYDKFINEIVPVNILKMITNPNFFPSMDWEKQRAIVMDLVGEIDDSMVLDKIMTVSNKQDYAGIINTLNQKQKISDYKSRLASEIKTVRDKQKEISPKIQENIRNTPDAIDEDQVNIAIESIKSNLTAIDDALNNKDLAAQNERLKVQEISNKISLLNSENIGIRAKHTADFNQELYKNNEAVASAESACRIISGKVDSLQITISSSKSILESVISKKTALLEKFHDENKRQMKPFDENEFKCPTCNRKHESADIEATKAKMIANFNNNKKQVIEGINIEGQKLMNEQKTREDQIKNYQDELAALFIEKDKAFELLDQVKQGKVIQNEVLPIETRIQQDAVFIKNTTDILSLRESLENRDKIDDSELIITKRNLNTQLFAEQQKLTIKDEIKKITIRIADLKAEEKELAQKIAEMQRETFAIERFVVAKVDEIEAKLNGRFKTVKFRMFEKQMNGGIKETCEMMMFQNGGFVPYNMLNTEGKLNSGLDVINTLCEHYNVYAPIVIDNRESTSDIIEVKSQVINLFVNSDYHTVTIK